MQTQKGFTLIELLVVIAIIGILAGMVVVNMSSAPEAAKNAKIQSYFDQLRTAATVHSTNNGNSYIGFDAAGDGAILKTKINEVLGTLGSYNAVSSTAAFCAKSPLIKGGTADTVQWCVDSAGFSGTTTASNCSTTGPDLTCN